MDAAAQMEAVLTSEPLADRVEMVVRPLGPDRYRAAAVDGTVEFERRIDGDTPTYLLTATTGRDPLERTSPGELVGHDVERGGHPDRAVNAYPHAHDSIAQFFDSPHAPDLLALHTAAHHTDGHLGQHGSLGVVQARAPFIAAGAGIRRLGPIDRSTRVVDVAPTIAQLLGFAPAPGAVGPTGAPRPDGLLRRQDGDPLTDVLDGTVADHVLVVLLDGCNANLLHHAIDAGEAPVVSRLVARGVDLRHGSIASLPTATLANHTTAVTGAHPGHSGVLHNTWLDRSDRSVPDLLSMQEMFWAAQHVAPEVETLFEALERNRPGAFSSATFEFCDRGATFSSFGLVRDGSGAALPDITEIDHVDPSCAERSAAYRFMSTVDHLSVVHTVECWDQVHGNEVPTISWCSLAVTDEAGHESGPHGELARAAVRDSDARIGRLLEAVERAGVLERTAVAVIADHGMEQTDPSIDATWDAELTATGIGYTEVGGGLIYLD